MSVKWELMDCVSGDSHPRGVALTLESIIYFLFLTRGFIVIHCHLLYCFIHLV